MLAIVSAVVSSIVLSGACALSCWKLFGYVQDRNEFKRFQKEITMTEPSAVITTLHGVLLSIRQIYRIILKFAINLFNNIFISDWKSDLQAGNDYL